MNNDAHIRSQYEVSMVISEHHPNLLAVGEEEPLPNGPSLRVVKSWNPPTS